MWGWRVEGLIIVVIAFIGVTRLFINLVEGTRK